MIEAHAKAVGASGEREARRREQARAWMWSLVDQGLSHAFREPPGGGEPGARARARRRGLAHHPRRRRPHPARELPQA